MKKIDTGEFSTLTGISTDTLRYYDKIGLLTPRKNNLRRVYSDEDLERAGNIIKLKSLNFSLDEIKALFYLETEIEGERISNIQNMDMILSCLEIIKKKYKEILEKESDIINIKTALRRMLDKTNNLLDPNV